MSFSPRLQRLHSGEMLCLSTCFFSSIVAHVLSITNFNICEICAYEIYLAFQKMLDPNWWRSLFENHSCTYGLVFATREVRAFSYSLYMYGLRCRMELSCLVEVGGIASQVFGDL